MAHCTSTQACMCRLYQQWAPLWATHCVPRSCSSQDDSWLEYRSDEGALVNCVEVWSLEVNVHVWTCSTQWTCTMCIRFTLNLHPLLNRFESGFSVDRPIICRIQSLKQKQPTKSLSVTALYWRMFKTSRSFNGTITQTHHVQVMCQNYSNKHSTQVYMKYNGYHGYTAQALIALQTTLGVHMLRKLK